MGVAEHLKRLSYELHTGRELEFMLERGKPLAYFNDAYPADPDEEIFPIETFAPYVANGTFECRDFVDLLTEPPPASHPQIRGTRRLFFARPSEGWRIDAYILLLRASERSGWSEGFERLEGRLLGYSDAECDEWLETLRTSEHTRNWYWLRRKG